MLQDNGRGGTAESNNKEYGGYINGGVVKEVKSGMVADPQNGNGAFINLPSKETNSFHSHPRGIKEENNTIYYFIQPPSKTDIQNAGSFTHYVFGRGDNMVYVYDANGVQAIIPIKRFINPKR